MEEKIGKITLNLDNYPGEDLYSDGGIEDEILDIVQAHPDGNYREAIEESGEWPVLYHLSHIRENIVRWVPLKGTEKCLEVGSGCGAITGTIAGIIGTLIALRIPDDSGWYGWDLRTPRRKGAHE